MPFAGGLTVALPLAALLVVAGLAGAGCALWSGSAVTVLPLFTLKYAHASISPSRAASSGPLTGVARAIPAPSRRRSAASTRA